MNNRRTACIKVTFGLFIYFLSIHTQIYSQVSAENERQNIEDSAKTVDLLKKGNALNAGDAATSKVIAKLQDSESKASPAEDQEPRVLKVYSFNNNDSAAGIGDIIVIVIYHLDSLLKRAEAADQTISLYVNGRKIDNIKPISGAPDKDNGTLQYRLDRNTENDKTWADILGAPPLFSNFFFNKPVKISAGLANKFAIKTLTDGDNFNLIRIHKVWFWSCCAIVILYLFVFANMVKYKGLLRDRGISLDAIGIANNSSRVNPYSLGRFQMAFWFTLTVISFFFIWLITDAYNIISTTVLALIGISTGTALSAAVIDNSKNADVLNQTIALQDESTKLNTQVATLRTSLNTDPAPANLVELQTKLNTAQDRISEITPLIARNIAVLTPKKSDGLIKDILTDANGVSFHRLQMFVWTFVLGLIFLYSVWKRLSMPEFDATLLALQGITAGTYLGFKFPEKQT